MSSLNDPKQSVAQVPRSPERMVFDDTGLLVVDMQQGFLVAQPSAAQIVFNTRRLLEAAKILGVRAAATEQAPEKLGPTLPELADLLPFPPQAKLAFSAGACAEIFAQWRDAGIVRVVICGIETHICVQQTALDLLADGYQTLVAVDAVGSRFEIDWDVALRRMEISGVQLTTTEAAMFEWCQDAGRPEFRAISDLAKRSP